MIRIILLLILIGCAAAGAAWVAEQTGDVLLTWGPLKITTTLPVAVLGVFLVVVAALLLWTVLRLIWRAPGHIRRGRHARRHARGRHAITHGLLAVGHGDPSAARQHADVARRHAADDPLTLLLHAQTAQLEGKREVAQHAFRSMTERNDTRLLGLRGLFIEAQRSDDPVAAVMIADEALKIAPTASWASHAVLGFRCAQGDWNGALAILGSNYSAGLLDKAAYRRQRGVLLTARGLDLETKSRDVARDSAMEAVKLAPTLVPAAVLAAKFESEAHQVRRAMKLLEAAWVVQPHPDIADAYAHVRLGDSARQRLSRMETLAAKTSGHIEGALALARAALDASEFKQARSALAPFTSDPTQRVAMLMAELERTEHNDAGKARAWTLRAVRARHDPAWTADGYVSDRWRPVSPVSGRLDAFQWQTPVASLPSDYRGAIDASAFEEAMLAPPHPNRPAIAEGLAEPSRQITAEPAVVTATQDNAPLRPAEPVVTELPVAAEPPVAWVKPVVEVPVQEPAKELTKEPTKDPVEEIIPAREIEAVAPAEPPAAPPPESVISAPAPLFRARTDLGKPQPLQAIVPIVRAPDDPGIEDDELARDEFSDQIAPKVQSGGWRGFLSRFGG